MHSAGRLEASTTTTSTQAHKHTQTHGQPRTRQVIYIKRTCYITVPFPRFPDPAAHKQNAVSSIYARTHAHAPAGARGHINTFVYINNNSGINTKLIF